MPEQPDLTRLKTKLVTSPLRRNDPALYEVVDGLLASTKQLQEVLNDDIASVSSILSSYTYLTSTDQSADLINSRNLTAGSNVTFDDSVANVRSISVHAPVALAGHTYLTAIGQSITANDVILGTHTSGNYTASVAGTASRISVSGAVGEGQAAIVDIAATYVGQTSITTLGTITTGTWNATRVAYTYITAASAASRLLGRGSASAGDWQEITLGSGVSMAGTVLSSTGLGGDVVGPSSSTDNAIARFDGTTGKVIQNSAVFILDTGELGVGTATPSKVLHVLGSSTTSITLLENTTSVDYAQVLNIRTPNITAGNHSGHFTFGVNDSSGGHGHFSFVTSGTANQGYISIGISNFNNLMILRGDGYVGIGTTSPDSFLSVVGPYGTSSQFRVQATGANSSGFQLWTRASGAAANSRNWGFITNWNTEGDFNIGHSTTNANSATNAFAVTIDKDGNVGIGTVSPSAKLHIAGGDVIINNTQKLYIDGGGNTYLYESSADVISFVNGGTERLRITSGGDLAIPAAAKIFLDGVAGAGDTYLREISDNSIRFVTNASDAMTVSATAITAESGRKLVMTAGTVFSGIISPTISGTENSWAPGGIANANIIRTDSSGTPVINGISSATVGSSWFCILWNINATAVTINHDSGTAPTPADRILTSTGAALTVSQNRGVIIWYDATTSRFRAAMI